MNGPSKLRDRQRPTGAIFLGFAAGCLAVVLGYVSPSFPPAVILGMAAATVGTIVVGRWLWLAAWVIIAALGVNPAIVSVAGWEARISDLVLAGLLVCALFYDRRVRPVVGGTSMLLMAAWVLVASEVAVVRDPSEAAATAASAGRLLMTLAATWILPALVVTPDHGRRVLRILGVASAGASAFGFATFLATGSRAGALGGPNALGLVAGVALVVALRGMTLWPERWLVALGGIVGLVASRSVASIVATAVALALTHRPGNAKPGRRLVRGAALVALAFAGVSALRPEVLPWHEQYRLSSAAVRVTAGYAGLREFAAHPTVGVGWQRSGAPGVINDPAVIEGVRRAFPDLRGYADVSPEGVTSVHNAYVQVLAEGGLIGLLLVGLAILWLARDVGTARRQAREAEGGGPMLAERARLAGEGILLTLAVWWNDNPLFGGQTESMLLPVALTLLTASALARGPEGSFRRRSGPNPGRRIRVPLSQG